MPVITTSWKAIDLATNGGVCDYCRILMEDNCPSEASLEVYRGDTLSIRVRTIREGAKLEIDGERHRLYRGKPSKRYLWSREKVKDAFK